MSVRFAGYAAVFDRVDRGGDVVRAGAFGTPASVPLLWQHGGPAVGTIETLAEDARGLRVIGRVEDARLAALVRAGAVGHAICGARGAAAPRADFRVNRPAVVAFEQQGQDFVSLARKPSPL
ncbi:MAG: HK97 family phage prohead protease [Sphingomonas sp.]